MSLSELCHRNAASRKRAATIADTARLRRGPRAGNLLVAMGKGTDVGFITVDDEIRALSGHLGEETNLIPRDQTPEKKARA